MNGIQFFQWGLGKQVPFRLRGAEVVDRLTLSDPNASFTAVSKESYEVVTCSHGGFQYFVYEIPVWNFQDKKQRITFINSDNMLRVDCRSSDSCCKFGSNVITNIVLSKDKTTFTNARDINENDVILQCFTSWDDVWIISNFFKNQYSVFILFQVGFYSVGSSPTPQGEISVMLPPNITDSF
nr:MAG TPA: hypothetical protein [Caudoviricetes sp.]